jgi:tungstate transport system ATP-binding protein
MMLTLSHITKGYGERTILSDCSYSFDRNGTYVLTGPNGCGKSTLLRICALIEDPDAGEIVFFSGSEMLKKDMALKRRMTLVLPRVGLFNTSVFKNAAYGLAIRGVPQKDIHRKVMSCLTFVGLQNKKNQHALTLSSGETQRLGIARALAIDPEFLFLDEPTASIDEENSEIIESIIGTMKKEGRSTVIMTTHDRTQAERLADRLVVMKHGRIEETPLP